MLWLTAKDLAAMRFSHGDITVEGAETHARRVLRKMRAAGYEVRSGASTGGRRPGEVRESDYRAWCDPTARQSQAA